jgi:hypothetical protein
MICPKVNSQVAVLLLPEFHTCAKGITAGRGKRRCTDKREVERESLESRKTA